MLAINNSHLDWDGGVQEVAEHDDVLRHQKVLKCNESKTVLLTELVDGLVGVEGVTANVGKKYTMCCIWVIAGYVGSAILRAAYES